MNKPKPRCHRSGPVPAAVGSDFCMAKRSKRVRLPTERAKLADKAIRYKKRTHKRADPMTHNSNQEDSSSDANKENKPSPSEKIRNTSDGRSAKPFSVPELSDVENDNPTPQSSSTMKNVRSFSATSESGEVSQVYNPDVFDDANEEVEEFLDTDEPVRKEKSVKVVKTRRVSRGKAWKTCENLCLAMAYGQVTNGDPYQDCKQYSAKICYQLQTICKRTQHE